jgi:CubicO group peptidase (beta-lactamase class C family)
MRKNTVLAALGLVILLSGPALAQDYRENRELPRDGAGERIRELIDVINSNDGARVRAFIETACSAEFRDMVPMERHVEVFADAYRSSGGFDFYGVREYEGEAPVEGTVVIVRNRLTEGWHALILDVEPEPPHRITSLGFGPARPPRDPGRAAKKLTDDEIVARLDAFVKRLAEADVFSGTVLLAKDGQVLYKATYGLASKRFDVPNRIDTKFNLGSMNKMFTGVAIQQLVERGKLRLTDPIARYVSTDWLPREITDKVQIRHLLTHTSGLGSYFNETFSESSRLRFRELDDYRPLIEGETLSFEPGTDWRYSNTGMFLLGVVIETATGSNYFDYVRENIYEPAGMKNTDCYDMDRPVKNLAIGYTRDGGEWINNLYLHVVRGGPAGGGFSTVEDLLLFDRALRGHKLLSREGTEVVWSAKPELGSPDYGFGFRVRGGEGERIVGHSGGFAGISSNLDMFLDSGYTAIAMSNYDDGASPVRQKMRELIAAAE